VTRVVESSYWDASKLNPQGLFKGVIDGVDEDVRRLGGSINYKGQQVVVSLSGQTKAVDLSAIDSLAELVQAFSSMQAFLLQQQRWNGHPPTGNIGVEGMVKSLDANSALCHRMSSARCKRRRVELGDRYCIGVEDGQVVIVEPMEGTPASKAGLKQGDLIMRTMANPHKG
jgi:S1-C subfamily serine protease